MNDIQKLKAKLFKVEASQEQKAINITSIAALLIEQELDPNLELLGIASDSHKLNDQYYLIESQQTKMNGNYLKVKAKDGSLLIEMLDGEFLIAEGITNEDCDYWNNLKHKVMEIE